MTWTIVISGAGLSSAAPAKAPLGDELRNAYIDAILGRAERARWRSLDELRRDPVSKEELYDHGIGRWRLETVVGMVRGLIGDKALDPLALVSEGSPNRAHELAAELLGSGRSPLHLTFNFDDLVERAYAALTGSPPESVTPDDADRLAWLAANDWVSERPVVVHLHGRVVDTGRGHRFPGLVATLDTIQETPPSWMKPLLRRALSEQVLVTGYRGLDTDVWPIFIEAASSTSPKGRTWNVLDLDGVAPEVRDALESQAFAFTGGGSVAALSRALGAEEESSNDRGGFDASRVADILSFDPAEATLLLAWILEDVGGQGRLEAMRLLGDCPPQGSSGAVVWRWLWKLGTTRRDGGRHSEALPYLVDARKKAPRRREGVRATLRLDEADAYRHLLREPGLIGRLVALIHLERCLSLATITSLGTQSREVVRQRAKRIRAHTLLRILDTPAYLPDVVRRRLALIATRFLSKAVHGPRPHETVFAYLQLSEAISHAYLGGAAVEEEAARGALVEAQRRAEFIAQPLPEGNVLCARALVETAFGDAGTAARFLDEANAVYAQAGHESGKDLVAARRVLLDQVPWRSPD